jgi:hypothetical protein
MFEFTQYLDLKKKLISNFLHLINIYKIDIENI